MTFLPGEPLVDGESGVQRYERLVQMRKRVIRRVSLVHAVPMVVALVISGVVFGPGLLKTYDVTLALQQRGVNTTATIESLEEERCGQECTRTVAHIQFPDAASQAVHKGFVVVRSAKTPEDVYVRAVADHKIPIVYDPGNTTIYRENFDDKIRTTDAGLQLARDIVVPIAPWAILYTIIFVIAWREYNKYPRLEDMTPEDRLSQFGETSPAAS